MLLTDFDKSLAALGVPVRPVFLDIPQEVHQKVEWIKIEDVPSVDKWLRIVNKGITQWYGCADNRPVLYARLRDGVLKIMYKDKLVFLGEVV